jgi:hypothetical protein
VVSVAAAWAASMVAEAGMAAVDGTVVIGMEAGATGTVDGATGMEAAAGAAACMLAWAGRTTATAMATPITHTRIRTTNLTTRPTATPIRVTPTGVITGLRHRRLHRRLWHLRRPHADRVRSRTVMAASAVTGCA